MAPLKLVLPLCGVLALGACGSDDSAPPKPTIEEVEPDDRVTKVDLDSGAYLYIFCEDGNRVYVTAWLGTPTMVVLENACEEEL